eukprot:425287-Amphidinium_carterae.2
MNVLVKRMNDVKLVLLGAPFDCNKTALVDEAKSNVPDAHSLGNSVGYAKSFKAWVAQSSQTHTAKCPPCFADLCMPLRSKIERMTKKVLDENRFCKGLFDLPTIKRRSCLKVMQTRSSYCLLDNRTFKRVAFLEPSMSLVFFVDLFFVDRFEVGLTCLGTCHRRASTPQARLHKNGKRARTHVKVLLLRGAQSCSLNGRDSEVWVQPQKEFWPQSPQDNINIILGSQADQSKTQETSSEPRAPVRYIATKMLVDLVVYACSTSMMSCDAPPSAARYLNDEVAEAC